MSILERIGNAGLVPVIVFDNAEDAVPTARALLNGGLDIMEITMRTSAGIQAIKNVRANEPGVLVGAGTVLTLEKCKECVEAGAQFIVSPGTDMRIVEWCLEHGVVVLPGCVTTTEIQLALAAGVKIVKFFPADLYGGVRAMATLEGPFRFTGIKFIPTGGVNNDNLSEYVNKSFIHAVGGGWLCNPADISSHNFSNITETVKKAIDILLGFEITHVGINQKTPVESLNTCRQFNKAFHFPIVEGTASNFVSPAIEVLKSKYLGTHGHLAVKTNNIQRGIYYLGKRGIEVDMETAKYNGDDMVAVYLKDEIGGFAVHLLKK